MKYLKNSPGMGLLFTKAKTTEVEIYVDADLVGSSLIGVNHAYITMQFLCVFIA